MNTMKEVLIKVGRFEQVVTIIDNIIKESKTKANYPITTPFIKNNEIIWSIDNPKVVVNEAFVFRKIIEGIEDDSDLSNFYNVIKTEVDCNLHNYAIAISHRCAPEVNMEHTRCLLIIQHLIDQLNIRRTYHTNEDYYIPDGWKIKDIFKEEN